MASATSLRRSLFILQCNLKRSSNMVHLHDYDIELIEREILWKYNDNRHDYSDCDCLLSLRKSMINENFTPCKVKNEKNFGRNLWHLHSAFHNLFDHMNFAITDFIYVRKFETEINIEINKKGLI